MSYSKKLQSAARRAVPVLGNMGVDERFLTFSGPIDPPARFYPPSTSDSKFQAEQALGDWAENAVCDALNRGSNAMKAVHFGWNGKRLAEEDGFREEYIAGVIDTCANGKRADLLLFDRNFDVPEDITALQDDKMKAVVKHCHGALEVRSSRLSARQYTEYQATRARNGFKPTSLVPNFTVKIEDLIKVYLWITLNKKPQAYVQVFFDEIHAIGFLDIMEYISSGVKLRVEKHKRSDKTTIMIPITEGREVGRVVESPTFAVKHNITKNGRHDIFANPTGGKITMDFSAVLASLE